MTELLSDDEERFREALRLWWQDLCRKSGAKMDELMAVESDLERGPRAQRLFIDEAFSSPEWTQVLAIIAADPNLSQQVGHKVGSAIFRGSELTAEQIAQAFIDEGMVALFIRREEPDPDVIFSEIFPKVHAYLSATNLSYEVNVPLIGLVCDVPTIILDEKTTIEQRGNQWDPFRYEIDQLLRDAGERSSFTDESPDPPQYRTVLRMRYSFPKLIGETTTSEEARKHFYDDVDLRVRDCMRSLASVVFLSIVAWPPYIRELGIIPRYDRGLRVLRPQTVTYFAAPGAIIGEAIVSPLVRAWDRLRNPNFGDHESNRAIGVALDRLAGLGAKSHSRSDQLVDTVIACEAFFTLGRSGYRQELGFRAAMARRAFPHFSTSVSRRRPCSGSWIKLII